MANLATHRKLLLTRSRIFGYLPWLFKGTEKPPPTCLSHTSVVVNPRGHSMELYGYDQMQCVALVKGHRLVQTPAEHRHAGSEVACCPSSTRPVGPIVGELIILRHRLHIVHNIHRALNDPYLAINAIMYGGANRFMRQVVFRTTTTQRVGSLHPPYIHFEQVLRPPSVTVFYASVPVRTVFPSCVDT